MTQLLFRARRDSTGAVQPSQVRCCLTDRTGKAILAFRGAHPYALDVRATVPAEGLQLDLAPQAALRRADAKPTVYRVEWRTAQIVERFFITVPETTGSVEFTDLLGITDTARDAFVLQTGVWVDAYYWHDTATWNDGATGVASVIASGYWDDDPSWIDDDLWRDET